MELIKFIRNFPNEESCRKYLRKKREEEGITCKCGSQKHYWIESKQHWRCSECRSTINLRSGTMMEKSKLPIFYWFVTIHLLTSTKKSFSALELQRQLGHKRYEPIWYMIQKIRITMGKRDKKYTLKGDLEVDDAFFEIVNLEDKIRKKDMKRGRGSQKQMRVMVMVESKPVSKEYRKKHRPGKSLGYVKMVVMDDLHSETINKEIEKSISKESKISTDGWRGYYRLPDVGMKHKKMIVSPKEGGKKLPWVHTVISNAKRLFLGVHHSIGKDFLQNYLDEFCYKLNRRHFDNLFDRLIVAGVNDVWY